MSGFLGLELHMAVRNHADSGNQTQALRKSSQFLDLLFLGSHPSGDRLYLSTIKAGAGQATSLAPEFLRTG